MMLKSVLFQLLIIVFAISFEISFEISFAISFEICFKQMDRGEGERFECDTEVSSFPGWLSWKPAHRRSLTTRFFGTSYFDFARF